MAHPKGEIEKPVALTKEVQEHIVTSLLKGNYLNTACLSAGITRWTFYHWKNRFDNGDPDAQVYADFFNNIKRAECRGEELTLDRLSEGSPGWQAQAWKLERRWPQRWGKKDRTPVPPKATKDLKDMTPEEFDAYKQSVATGKDSG
jgi:transposase